MPTDICLGYNNRLFGHSLYGMHHKARFTWLERRLKELNIARASVLELGCFDAKTVDWIPFDIVRYVGLDAGWESSDNRGQLTGLAAAEHRFRSDPRFLLKSSTDPGDLRALDDVFDFGICMETLEHIPPDRLEDYVAALAAKIQGHLFITVPNEKGVALLCKTLGARLLCRQRDIGYKRGEWINSLLGRLDQVERVEHKGFDYTQLASLLRRHFRDVELQGVGFNAVPLNFHLTIGMIARP